MFQLCEELRRGPEEDEAHHIQRYDSIAVVVQRATFFEGPPTD